MEQNRDTIFSRSALQKLLVNPLFKEGIQSSKEKNIVIFMGLSGSGKSTFINYLLGRKLEKKRVPGKGKVLMLPSLTSAADNNNYPKISEDVHRAETLYSRSYQFGEDVFLCDTAGFLDTGHKNSPERKIVASISTQLSIQTANKTNLLVITIEWGNFVERAKDNLANISAAVTLLLNARHPYTEISDSIVFLITRIPSEILEDMELDTLQDGLRNEFQQVLKDYEVVLKEQEEALKENHRENEFERLNHSLCMLELLRRQIIDKPKNVIFGHVLDGGRAKKQIVSILDENKKKSAISKEKFNFNTYDENRFKFNSLINTIINDGIVCFKRRIEVQNKIVEKKYELRRYSNSDHTLDKAVDSFVKAMTDKDEKKFLMEQKSVIEKMSDELKATEEAIKKYNDEEKSVKETINALLDEKASIDTSEEVLLCENIHLKEPFLASGTWFSWLKYCRKKVTYPDVLKGVPFLKIAYLAQEGGALIIENIDAKKGIFEAVYESPWGTALDCVFEIYGEKRYVPENEARLVQIAYDLEHERVKKEGILEELKKEGVKQTSLKDLLEKTEKCAATNDGNQLITIKTELTKSLKNSGFGDIPELKQNLETSIVHLEKDLLEIDKEIGGQVEYFDFIEEMNELEKTFSPFGKRIQLFTELYKQYKNAIKMPEKIESLEDLSQELANFDEDEIINEADKNNLDTRQASFARKAASFEVGTIERFHFEVLIDLCKAYSLSNRDHASVEARGQFVSDSIVKLVKINQLGNKSPTPIAKNYIRKIIFKEAKLNILPIKWYKSFVQDAKGLFDINVTDELSNTLLHYACLSQLQELVNSLLELGAKVDIKNSDQKTVLFIAAEQKQYSVFEKLVKYQKTFSTEILTDKMHSVFDHLITPTLENANMVGDLCSRGAKFPVSFSLKSNSSSALHTLINKLQRGMVYGVDQQHPSFILLSQLLNVLSDGEKQECLLISCKGESLLSKILKLHDQDLKSIKETLNVFVIANVAMNPRVLGALIDADEKNNIYPIILEKWKINQDVLNQPLTNGETLLTRAVRRNHKPIVTWLLQHGADRNQKSQKNLRQKSYPSPEVQNTAIRTFLGNGNTKDNCLFYDVFYPMDVFLYGLNLTENKSNILCGVFESSPESNNAIAFQKQLKALVELSNATDRVTIFAAKAPEDNIHFIGGLYYKQNLLLIDPLGEKGVNKLFSEQVVAAKALNVSVFISNTMVQNAALEVNNKVSSGPIVFEILLYLKTLPTDTLLNVLNSFSQHQSVKEAVVPDYTMVDIDILLPDSLRMLMQPDIAFKMYHNIMLGLRLTHSLMLRSRPPELAVTHQMEIYDYLEEFCVNTPTLKLMRLLVNDPSQSAIIQKTPEYAELTQVRVVSINHPQKIDTGSHENILCFSPLQWAIFQNHSVIVSHLISNSVDLNVLDDDHNNLIHLAIERKYILGFWKLLGDAEKSKLNKQFWQINGNKKTPLKLAEYLKRPSEEINFLQNQMLSVFIKQLCLDLEANILEEKSYLIKQESFLNDFIHSNERAHSIRATIWNYSGSQPLFKITEQIAVAIKNAIYQDIKRLKTEQEKSKVSFPVFEKILLAHLVIKEEEIPENLPLIPVQSPVNKTEKQVAFLRALKDALRTCFYVSRAIYENKVTRGRDALDKVGDVAETVLPGMSGKAGFEFGLTAMGGVAAIKLLEYMRDEKTRYEAARFVEAFGKASPRAIERKKEGILIDHSKLKLVADALYFRYRDQIEQCSLSREDSKPNLTETDGIYVLAQCMADRIFVHILNGGSKDTDSDKNFAVRACDYFAALLEPADQYVETKLYPLHQRCILALLRETEGKEDIVARGANTENSKLPIWQAGGILALTGIKFKGQLYTNDSSRPENYGFCYLDPNEESEIEKRGFKSAPAHVVDCFSEKTSNQKLFQNPHSSQDQYYPPVLSKPQASLSIQALLAKMQISLPVKDRVEIACNDFDISVDFFQRLESQYKIKASKRVENGKIIFMLDASAYNILMNDSNAYQKLAVSTVSQEQVVFSR